MSTAQENLIWLDRLHARLPGYTGYLAPAGRGATDTSLRDAIASRLESARGQIEDGMAQLRSHETDREMGTLDALESDLIALAERVRRAVIPPGMIAEADYGSNQAEVLHRLDHSLLEAADRIVESASRPDGDHDWLPNLRALMREFETRLDERILGFTPSA